MSSSGIAQHFSLQKFAEPLLESTQTAGATLVGFMVGQDNNQRCMAAAAAIQAASGGAAIGTHSVPAGKAGESACDYIPTDLAAGTGNSAFEAATKPGGGNWAYSEFDFEGEDL